MQTSYFHTFPNDACYSFSHRIKARRCLCCYFTISYGIVEVSFKDLNRLKSSQSVVHIFLNFETGFHPSKWFEMSCHIEESS